MSEGAPAAAAPPAPGRAQTAIRRLIVAVIQFALVVTAAIGVSGLLERALTLGRTLSDDGSLLARSLAFTVIAVPLTALLWWWWRRKLAEPEERASISWALYLTVMSLVAVIVSTVALATCLAAAIGGEWRGGDLAVAIVWAGVWLWHAWMRRSPATAPSRLREVPVALGAAYGLAVAVIGAIGALSVLLSEAFGGVAPVLASSQGWGAGVLQALVWAVIGTGVWGWHWLGERVRDATGGFAVVLLVAQTAAAAAASLLATGTVLWIGLRLLFDTAPVADVVAPLDTAIATALIAGIVWVYLAMVVATASAAARGALRLVLAGVALVGAASGFGVVVNALLATFSSTIGDDPRSLLLGGIAALVVAGPVWWAAWRPDRAVDAPTAATPARRVYLVAVFGASAVVAIITVLTIGYRLFEFALDGGTGDALIERVRAPLGLLAATAIVFAYHFTVWRRDRALARTVARSVPIPRLVVVADADPGELATTLRTRTGAHVTLWRAAGPGIAEVDLPAVVAALDGVDAPRALVVRGDGGRIVVAPLAE